MTETAMTSIPHLWKLSKFFEKIQNPEVAKLRMHYIQCCREIGDEIDLPKQNFGPAILCPQCGIAWTTTKHKTRITPRKTPPQHMENLMCTSQSSSTRLPKHRRTLIRKCEQNKTNKMVKICSVCSNRAKFSLSKPERRKLPKTKPANDANSLSSKKKKKNRSRDKTAGLNLSAINSPQANETKDSPQDKSHTPLLLMNNKKKPKTNTPTSVAKPQKMNLAKLKGLMNTNFTPSKKSKLHSFLQEL